MITLISVIVRKMRTVFGIIQVIGIRVGKTLGRPRVLLGTIIGVIRASLTGVSIIVVIRTGRLVMGLVLGTEERLILRTEVLIILILIVGTRILKAGAIMITNLVILRSIGEIV